MRHFFHLEIKIKFEKINSADSSIRILKQRISFFSNLENREKKRENPNCFEKKKVVRISKIKSIKKMKRISRNFRSKECLTSSNTIFVDVATYNFLSKQKNVKLFVIFFKNIDDQIQKNTDTSIDLKIVLSKEFHDMIDILLNERRMSRRCTENMIIK